MDDQNQIAAICIKCDAAFTLEQIKGYNFCPNCKTKTLPKSPKEDVNININLYELKILCMWAENYSIEIDNKNLDNPNYELLRDTILKISSRIKKQLPPEFKNYCLTWKDEMGEFEKAGINAELYRDGKEII